MPMFPIPAPTKGEYYQIREQRRRRSKENIMGNNLRCCLACILPCGALDMIRVVHLNGLVEELSQPISAGDILRANPGHILTKPTSHGVVHRILILSPGSELKRGSIYFLIPSSSVPEKKRVHRKKLSPSMKSSKSCTYNDQNEINDAQPGKKSSRKVGRMKVWQPHLEKISED